MVLLQPSVLMAYPSSISTLGLGHARDSAPVVMIDTSATKTFAPSIFAKIVCTMSGAGRYSLRIVVDLGALIYGRVLTQIGARRFQRRQDEASIRRVRTARLPRLETFRAILPRLRRRFPAGDAESRFDGVVVTNRRVAASGGGPLRHVLGSFDRLRGYVQVRHLARDLDAEHAPVASTDVLQRAIELVELGL